MIQAPGKVSIVNVTLPLANNLYFYDVPQDTCHFLVKSRNGSNIKMSFNDESDYITLNRGTVYYEQNLRFNGALSFISNQDNEVMEIICWSGGV